MLGRMLKSDTVELGSCVENSHASPKQFNQFNQTQSCQRPG